MVHLALKEIDGLRALTGGLAERVAAQAELLSRRAEKVVQMEHTPFPPVTNKTQMYRLLSTGLLGNTVPQWFDLGEWKADPEARRYPLWGVRSMQKMNPHMRLDVPASEVPAFVHEFHGGRANLSPMVDQWMVFRCEVFEADFAPVGLRVFGTADRKLKWRQAFAETGREWTGLAAHEVLKHFLWPADYEGLRELLERYPGHVVELTACDRAVGRIPGRNAAFWEVRKY